MEESTFYKFYLGSVALCKMNLTTEDLMNRNGETIIRIGPVEFDIMDHVNRKDSDLVGTQQALIDEKKQVLIDGDIFMKKATIEEIDKGKYEIKFELYFNLGSKIIERCCKKKVKTANLSDILFLKTKRKNIKVTKIKISNKIKVEMAQEESLILNYIRYLPFHRSYLHVIEHQTPTIRLEEVKRHGRFLEFVENQTPEICLEAVKNDGFALRFVENQTLEICDEALKENSMSLKYVKNQTPEMCVGAVRDCVSNILYVKDPNPDYFYPLFKDENFGMYNIVKFFRYLESGIYKKMYIAKFMQDGYNVYKLERSDKNNEELPELMRFMVELIDDEEERTDIYRVDCFGWYLFIVCDMGIIKREMRNKEIVDHVCGKICWQNGCLCSRAYAFKKNDFSERYIYEGK